jgi:hypothetical protein
VGMSSGTGMRMLAGALVAAAALAPASTEASKTQGGKGVADQLRSPWLKNSGRFAPGGHVPPLSARPNRRQRRGR